MARKAEAPDARRLTRYAAFGPDMPERDAVLLAFGKRLRALRVAARVSQERFAPRCFMRLDQISRFERGLRPPNILDLLILEQRLGVTGGELIRDLQAPVRRVGTAQVLDLIRRQPGITAEALATSLELPSSYAFEIALYLLSTGEIVSKHSGWHPAPGTTGGTKGS